MGQHLRFLALAALTLCTSTSASTPAAPEPAPRQKDYDIRLGQFVLLPSLAAAQLGVAAEFAEGATILKAPIAFDEYAINMDPISLPIASVSLNMPSQVNLAQVRSIKGGDSDGIPKGAVTFCSRPTYNVRAAVKRMKPVVQKDFKARFSDTLSACFIDSDTDLKFDRYFLVGAKTPEDRRVQPLQPTPYRTVKDAPLVGNSYLKLVYSGGDFMIGQNIDLLLFVNGLKLRYDGMTFPANPEMPDARFYMPFKATALPVKFKVASAELSVQSVSADAKTAKISIVSDFTRTPFRVYGIGSTMNLYFPVN